MNYIKTDRNTMFGPMEDRMNVEEAFTSLMAIDFMATELCNRTCVFCPRAHGYPNLNLHMDLKIVDKIGSDLGRMNYQNRLLFCGFGESLLYKHLTESFKLLKKHMPWQKNLHMVTNGDRLNPDKVEELMDAGLDKFFLSLYDGPEQVDYFGEMFDKLGLTTDQYIFQHYYKTEDENYGFLKLSNRAGWLDGDTIPVHGCNIPFYNISLHWNGDILLCSHDWEKKQVFDNIMNTPIEEIWLRNVELWKFRETLKKDRSCHPCNKCDVQGVIFGNKSRETLLEYANSK